MRKCLHIAAIAAAALIAAASASAQPAAAAAAAPTVDELVAKDLQARGGEAKLKAITTMRLTGKVSVQGMELPMTVTAKRPNMMRQEMTIQDKKIVTAYDGTTAWMINPMMGSETPQEIQGPQSELAKEQSDFDGPLIDYKAKGNTIELIKGDGPNGTDKLSDGTPVYKLKITRKTGRVQYYYLDAKSGIELKTTTEIDQGGNKMNIEQELSDYRAVDGIQVPHAMRSFMNGQPIASVVVDKTEFNVPVEDTLFKMPAAPPKQ